MINVLFCDSQTYTKIIYELNFDGYYQKKKKNNNE